MKTQLGVISSKTNVRRQRKQQMVPGLERTMVLAQPGERTSTEVEEVMEDDEEVPETSPVVLDENNNALMEIDSGKKKVTVKEIVHEMPKES